MNAATRPVVASLTIEAPTSVMVVVNVNGDVCDVLKVGDDRQNTRIMEPGEFLLQYVLADSPAVPPVRLAEPPVLGPAEQSLGNAFKSPTAELRDELALIGRSLRKHAPKPAKAKPSKKPSPAAEVGPEQPRPPVGETSGGYVKTTMRRSRIVALLKKSGSAQSSSEIAKKLRLPRPKVAYDLNWLTMVDGKVDPKRAVLIKDGYLYQVRQ